MNNKKQKLVPELRFPEFENNWNIVRLKDVSTYFNGKSFEGNVQAKGNYELITLKSIDTVGNLVHSNRFINDKVPTLAKGTLVMILSEQAPGLLGMTAIIPEENKYVLNQRVAEIRPNNKVESYFLSKAINSNQAYFSRLGAGMKVQNISKPNVENYEFGIPIIAEQQKIANCLSSLDEVITAETKKLDLLQDHKKGLLQQLFPAEGETQPKFRFPEFVNDGDWEEKELEDVCNIYNNRRKPISSSKREKGNYPYYGASGIIDYVKNFIFDERLLLIGEDGAKWGAYEKTAFIVEGKYWVNNHAHVLEPTLIDDKLLENFLVKIDIHPFITGAAPPKLTLNNLKKIPVPVPPSVKEQQKIAKCLSSVDDLIDAQSKKIQALKKHKKGLMQRLFPKVNSLTI